MGKMKKIMVAGAVCYVAYKLGKKYLRENNLTVGDVADRVKAKAEEFVKQAVGIVPDTGEEYTTGRKIYTFGADKRIALVHLSEGVTGLYDNKKNYPIEKKVKSYSEEGDKLYVYSDQADYVLRDAPFFMNVYVKEAAEAETIAAELGAQYDPAEAAVYRYGSDEKLDIKGLAAQAAAAKIAEEQAAAAKIAEEMAEAAKIAEEQATAEEQG